MKNLLNIVLLSFLVSCMSSPTTEKVSKKICFESLPKEYREYKNKPMIEDGLIEFGEGRMCAYKEYDIDSDGISEVIEIYSTKEKPIAYGFDVNKNNNFDCWEILTDKDADGLNGNEKNLPEKICEENPIFI